ncbi:uncharacterized protein At5g65660 [Solanum lycopersicum]|uniref:Hydroxyproline-rich glycoprotein family protein n=1 Tax=Solanum lycopersicum TaxID=4081 RepID=A0A3Q7FGF1_SOLLC|nr:uncharacterized protein At5g65660 [Solanum lycopersicum]
MDNQYYAPPHSDASRPSLGFPLGTAVLLIVIFSLSGIFSCCYHWEKLRSLRRSFADLESGLDPTSMKYKQNHTNWKQRQSPILPAVLMPGDEFPKFIAMPCPCQFPASEKVVHELQKLPLPLPSPPKPPRTVAAVPFY